ncbi:MAG: hypothetical protein R3F59_19180 [Myxococcota bacterium]
METAPRPTLVDGLAVVDWRIAPGDELALLDEAGDVVDVVTVASEGDLDGAESRAGTASPIFR